MARKLPINDRIEAILAKKESGGKLTTAEQNDLAGRAVAIFGYKLKRELQEVAEKEGTTTSHIMKKLAREYVDNAKHEMTIDQRIFLMEVEKLVSKIK